jgi:hypothetical protein
MQYLSAKNTLTAHQGADTAIDRHPLAGDVFARV